MTAKAPSALPAFVHTWVGGDIHGLSAFAGTLYGYLPRFTEVTDILDHSVGALAHDAGWHGDASAAFQEAWTTDSLAAEALATVVSSAGDVVDALAFQLATVEAALEKAADEARTQGVLIGADGAVAAGPVAGTAGDTGARDRTATSYTSFRTECLQVAQQARVDAATRMESIYSQIAPPGSAAGKPSTGDDVTIGDYLRGFWAVPSAYRKTVQEEADALKGKAAAAKAAWTKAKAARPNPRVPLPSDVKDALHDARSQLSGVEGKLTAAEAKEGVISKVLDTRVSAAFSKLGALAATDTELSAWQKSLRFMGDVPVIDVAAAGLGTYFMARDDHDKGQSWGSAIAEDGAANVAGVAIGAVAGAAVAGAAVFAGAPVAAVVAGAAVGGVVCVGVGDLTSNLFHEHWDEDINKDGIIGGIGDGIGHSVTKTGSDIADLGKKAWHGIFG